MKKSLIIILSVSVFIFLMFVSGVYAISSDIKESYEPKETGLVKLSGNILEAITPAQAEFKRINVNIPVEYDIKKIREDYYLWFIAPENNANYTLKIRDIATTVSGINKKINYTVDFRVEGNLTDYYINPGFIITDKDFEIEVFSNLDETISLDSSFNGGENIEIKPGINKILYTKDEFDEDIESFNIGRYSIPSVLTESNTGGVINNNGTPIIIRSKFVEVYPSSIEGRVLLRSKPSYYFSIKNIGNERLKNVYLDYDRRILSVTPDSRIELERNQSYGYNISFRNEFNASVYSKINVYYNNESYPLYIMINTTNLSNEIYVNYSYQSNVSVKGLKCYETGGTFCLSGKICSIDSVKTLDGDCCTGVCLEKPKTSYAWLGYLIGGIVVLVLLLVGVRYYQSKTGSGLGNSAFEKSLNMDKKLP